MERTKGAPDESAGKAELWDRRMVEETVSDPRWFPLRFDVKSESYHFAFIPADTHRSLKFLSDLRPESSKIRILARSAVAEVAIESRPLYLILHSGLGGSTLVARSLSQPGVAIALLEPPILSDIIAYGERTSSEERDRLLIEATRLMARPLADGEAVVCKLSGVGNGLAEVMATVHPESRLLCLQNRLSDMLASLASHRKGGRMAGRQLLIGLRNSRMFAYAMTDKQLLDFTDFQMAALAWLSIQKIMLAAAEALGPGRVASLTSDQLMKDTAGSVSAIASHFRLALDVDACVAAGVFDRHSKGGEPFDAKKRAERVAEALRAYGEEIEPVVNWARSIAEKTRIPWDLPYPLRT
jgi:hypothetical protein